jgi:hypothetical protein
MANTVFDQQAPYVPQPEGASPPPLKEPEGIVGLFILWLIASILAFLFCILIFGWAGVIVWVVVWGALAMTFNVHD